MVDGARDEAGEEEREPDAGGSVEVSRIAQDAGLFERILRLVPGWLYIFDVTERRLVYVNPQWEALGYGVAESLALGSELATKLMHPDDLLRFPDILRRYETARDGEVIETESRWRTVAGEWRWLYTRDAVFSRNPDGSPRQIVGLAVDITERKQTAQQVAAFAELGRRLGAAHTPAEAARIIVDVADELLGWDACSLDLFDEGTGRVHPLLTVDLVGGKRTAVEHAYADTPIGVFARRVIAEGALLILRPPTDVAAEEPSGLVPFGDTSRRSASLMFVPIRDGIQVAGILSIQSYRPYAYGDDSLTTLQALADHCGGTLARIRAQEALRDAGTRQRTFVREVLYGASDGRLRLCDQPDELPDPLPTTYPVMWLAPEALSFLRRIVRDAAHSVGFSSDRMFDLLTAVGEAAINALLHGGGGTALVSQTNAGTVQVRIDDQGTGIASHHLHRATLEKGYTTAGTLGHGFPLMLKTADRVWLYTGPSGTTVVIEQDREPADHQVWIADGSYISHREM
jgi:PAS domain S-box-containing protein